MSPSARRGGHRRYEPYLFASAFTQLDGLSVTSRAEITLDEIVGRAYSMSTCSPDRLGDRQARFRKRSARGAGAAGAGRQVHRDRGNGGAGGAASGAKKITMNFDFEKFQQTKAYDLLMGLPLIFWFGYVEGDTAASVAGLCGARSCWRDPGSLYLNMRFYRAVRLHRLQSSGRLSDRDARQSGAPLQGLAAAMSAALSAPFSASAFPIWDR